MFIERLLNSGATPAVERRLAFTAARHRLLAENVANVDTPGYVPRDLNDSAFRVRLREDLAALRRGRDTGATRAHAGPPAAGILFQDGSPRSVERLVTDQAKNALQHNLMAELLRKQFGSIHAALRERPS